MNYFIKTVFCDHTLYMITELRKNYRVYDIALLDLVGSLVGGYVVGKYIGINPYIAAVSTIPIGVGVHLAFGVKTKLTKVTKLWFLNQMINDTYIYRVHRTVRYFLH